jgi:hypothetical protein
MGYCRPEHRDLLPDYVSYVSVLHKGKFYREFNLTEAKLAHYWLTALNLRDQARHLLLLQAAGLYVLEDKDNIKAPKTDKQIKVTDEVHFCFDDSEFSKMLKKEFQDCNHIDPNDSTIIHLSSPRGVVFTHDSPLIYYYLYLNIPVLIFMQDNMYKHQNQIKLYDNQTIYRTPSPDIFDEALEAISKFMKGK